MVLVCYILRIPAPFQVEKKLIGAHRYSYPWDFRGTLAQLPERQKLRPGGEEGRGNNTQELVQTHDAQVSDEADKMDGSQMLRNSILLLELN